MIIAQSSEIRAHRGKDAWEALAILAKCPISKCILTSSLSLFLW
jgi:hypothetical protein